MIEWIVSSCILILLITAIRQLFRKRLDLKIRYALWMLVAVRLLVPVSFAESRFSVLNLLNTDRFSGTERAGVERDTGDVRAAVADSAILWGENKIDLEELFEGKGDVSGAAFRESEDDPKTLHDEGGTVQAAVYGENGSDSAALSGEQLYGERFQEGQQVKERKSLEQEFSNEQFWGEQLWSVAGKMFSMGSVAGQLPAVIWLIGALLCGMVISAVNLRDGRKRLRSRVPLAWEGESSLPVYVSDTVPTPCMAGIYRPAIYLTREAAEEEKQLPYIIAHENMHFRHRDHWWAVVRTVCLCVHWFNPLVWMAARLARQDGELACDADVLKHFDREKRVAYGKALLELSIQKDVSPVTVNLATTMSGGKKQLRERLEMIRQRPGRAAGVLAAVAVLVAVVLTVTFTGKRESDAPTDISGEGNSGLAGAADLPEGFLPEAASWDNYGTNPSRVNAALFDPPLQGGLLLKTDSNDSAGESNRKPEEQSDVGYVFGYNDYTGYLDECVQWLYYGNFIECDYDGDGITDRVWRENIQDWGVADYRIEFGNGDVIELPKTAGGIPEVRSLDLEGDGVREILFTETFDYSTNPKGYGQMALLRKAGEDYEMMELPVGISRVDSEEQANDGNMVRYQPSLPCRYEPAGEYRMHVTCPALENVEGMEPLDVVVDFTQEEWEMGNYGEFYPADASSVAYRVDIFSLESGRDALRLYFGVLDKWCNDDIVMTLEWKAESLCISDIRYWHDYIETAYAEIGGQQYELILRGSGYVGGDQYTIDSILVNYIHYEERFKGMVEDNVQFIDPGEAAKQYWGEGYASDGGVMAKAVSSGRNGNILVADLNFDGNEDFCIQGWITGGSNIPYYCYFWNENTGQFEYGGCLTNVAVDENLKCVKSTVYKGEGSYGVQYYRYEDEALVLERYVKGTTSSNAVFDYLDLTYVETSYSMDRADYLKDAPRLFLLAEKALAELYQMTGTEVEAAYFTVTEYGDFNFASTEQELKASRVYYIRCYGAQGGFKDCITHIIIADEQMEYGPRTSPVKYLVWPPDQDSMTDEEIVQWHFENSPFAQNSHSLFGNTALRSGDTVDSIEETFEGNYVLKMRSGKYFELTYNKDTKMVNSYYGPYESFPEH